MFPTISSLLQRFVDLGAINAFSKQLAENDNCKQQIYLGGSFDILQMFPFAEIEAFPSQKVPNYKAKLRLYWVTEDAAEIAQGAQLILYPKYPEVRLSGFLRGCRLAPSEHLQPVPAEMRKFNKGPDGRVLFFAITGAGETLAYLAPAGSALAREFASHQNNGRYLSKSVFYELPLPRFDSKLALLKRLSEIRDHGWHDSMRLNKAGEAIPYKARNGGGYTLEALLGIIPNGRAEPDYLGWEIKAYSRDRITLMTPEPDAGLYGQQGVEAFVRRFGSPTQDDTLYFTGTHRAGCRNEKTCLTMMLRGFDEKKNIVTDVAGAIELLTDSGECVAGWSYADLMLGWNKKHAHAAYVPYESRQDGDPAYKYMSPALLGEGTDFTRYLAAVSAGLVVFDPGSKVMAASTTRSKVKARSQFRMSLRHLPTLYRQFGPAEF
ncbi:MAG: MvaI/BcnI family restriction endonuclease [Rhodocyclaceae bacterium]